MRTRGLSGPMFQRNSFSTMIHSKGNRYSIAAVTFSEQIFNSAIAADTAIIDAGIEGLTNWAFTVAGASGTDTIQIHGSIDGVTFVALSLTEIGGTTINADGVYHFGTTAAIIQSLVAIKIVRILGTANITVDAVGSDKRTPTHVDFIHSSVSAYTSIYTGFSAASNYFWFQVTGASATQKIDIQVSTDGTSYASHDVVNCADGSLVTGFITADGIYRFGLSANEAPSLTDASHIKVIRAGTLGTVTVSAIRN